MKLSKFLACAMTITGIALLATSLPAQPRTTRSVERVRSAATSMTRSYDEDRQEKIRKYRAYIEARNDVRSVTLKNSKTTWTGKLTTKSLVYDADELTTEARQRREERIRRHQDRINQILKDSRTNPPAENP